MRSAKTTIFLDFDGVVHPAGCLCANLFDGRFIFTGELLFCWAPILWRLIKPHNCEIVIHSTWRDHFQIEELRERFPSPLRSRIVATTEGWGRFESIVRYVKTNAIRNYLVLDDQPEEFPEKWERLLICNSELGIRENAVQEKIINFLIVSNERNQRDASN